MTVGERIAKLRERRGLSQAQLAKELKVGTSTLGMWETGKRRLKDDTLKMIAEYFNVSSDYLLGIDSKNAAPSNFKVETVAAHIDDDVSDEQMEDILNYIDFIKQKHSKKD
ncbi:helix-turn-helix transcriptional regulator [Enterococcus viikkiensis]|uniref:Helix-turn-helix transcriptional regulator n=1 Tax=Enterococcus viikkiensis TaxID=930854 RepID=A0ABU3FSR3_9ENTE|nr:helix-turn-helix transcriptional regulator [Enterococcus viikkiensis]MDT2829015.1 helix-turn-helix transcriptional regulator [Enterococcus viikkiensis]